MTGLEIMETGAARAGFRVTNTSHKASALTYLNSEIAELLDYTDWWWQYTVATEALTEAGGSAVDLETDIVEITHFWNVTDNIPVTMRNISDIDFADPDVSEDGQVESVALTGINNSTGAWQAYFWRIVNKDVTIKYRYYKLFPKIVSADAGTGELLESVDLDTYLPRPVQRALYHGISEMFLSSRLAQDDAAAANQRKLSILELAASRNDRSKGSKGKLGQRNVSASNFSGAPVIQIGTIT